MAASERRPAGPLTPWRCGADDGPGDGVRAVLALIRAAFAGMEGRIDPPSSVRLLTEATLTHEAARAEIWCLGHPPQAAVILTPKGPDLWLGKFAVAPGQQGRGLGRRLVAVAALRARVLGCARLVLQTRVELTENHRTFEAMGFARVGEDSHPGHDRPTSYLYARALPGAD